MLVDLGTHLTKTDDAGQIQPKVGPRGPSLAKLDQIWRKGGPDRSEFDEVAPKLGCRISATSRQMSFSLPPLVSAGLPTSRTDTPMGAGLPKRL